MFVPLAMKAEYNLTRCACSRVEPSFLQPLLSSLVCSYPSSRVNLACFLEGGGGGSVLDMQSLAKDAALCHTYLDAFLINKQKIETKFSCSFQHAYTLQLLSTLLQRTASDKTASPLVLFIERFPCPSVKRVKKYI